MEAYVLLPAVACIVALFLVEVRLDLLLCQNMPSDESIAGNIV